MAKKEKPHDLRDDIYAPRTTITNTDERLAGAERRSINPENGNPQMVTPTPGKNIPDGATTKG